MKTFFRSGTRVFLLLLGIPLGWLSAAVAQEPLETITFQVSDADFVNPERGFMKYRDLTSPFGFDQVRPSGSSLIYGRIVADDFRDAPLSPQFLAEIQAGFDLARTHGLKVKPRVAYNNGIAPDAPKSVILQHIQQLQPLWEANQDVISHLDAGFIGAWGEWHSSTNGLENPTDRRDILLAILDALPQNRMVGIRTPHFKREIFSGSQTSDAVVITPEIAFDGSDVSRVGHLNDCFLSSPTDFGTYAHTLSGWPRDREIAYIGGESRFAPFGGETCAVHPLGESANALSEMERLHIDYLNRDYNQDVIQRWIDDGSFDEISRRLGYRYQLRTAGLPNAVKPSGLLELHFDIDNVGFGELFNPRQVEVTLKNMSTGEIHRAPLSVDPRFWTGGTSQHVETHLAIPASMTEGVYAVGLALPDLAPTLRDDVRYTIRFANLDVWDEATGTNQLKSDLVITRSAAGPMYSGLDAFREVDDPSTLNLLGDLDGDGQYACVDVDLLVSGIATNSSDSRFDLTGDGLVDLSDLELWLTAAGAAQLASGRPYLTGDANLDGVVDTSDFNLWNSHKFTAVAAWCSGDFNADGAVDASDFNLWNSQKFTSSDTTVLPEPQMWGVAALALGSLLRQLARPARPCVDKLQRLTSAEIDRE